jgi:hypothetical protein
MPTPRPEADMLHMQHAQMISLLVRRQEAERFEARRAAAAKARPAAPPEPASARRSPQAPVHRPSPA